MLQTLVEFQRTIYLALADQIKLLAAGGGWLAFFSFLPMGVVFGAAHALTPGHSKAVLATYLAGSDTKVSRGLLASIALSVTHVT
ncbi:ABC transporter permease, partial [Mesorhizobium sp. M4A.F.Ca.ET.029.04.2.1]